MLSLDGKQVNYATKNVCLSAGLNKHFTKMPKYYFVYR